MDPPSPVVPPLTAIVGVRLPPPPPPPARRRAARNVCPRRPRYHPRSPPATRCRLVLIFAQHRTLNLIYRVIMYQKAALPGRARRPRKSTGVIQFYADGGGPEVARAARDERGFFSTPRRNRRRLFSTPSGVRSTSSGKSAVCCSLFTLTVVCLDSRGAGATGRRSRHRTARDTRQNINFLGKSWTFRPFSRLSITILRSTNSVQVFIEKRFKTIFDFSNFTDYV